MTMQILQPARGASKAGGDDRRDRRADAHVGAGVFFWSTPKVNLAADLQPGGWRQRARVRDRPDERNASVFLQGDAVWVGGARMSDPWLAGFRLIGFAPS
jgi:hypothetical protein